MSLKFVHGRDNLDYSLDIPICTLPFFKDEVFEAAVDKKVVIEEKVVGNNVNDADHVKKTGEKDSSARENFQEDSIPNQQKETKEI